MKSSNALSRRELLRLMGGGVVGAVAATTLAGLPQPALAQGSPAAPRPLGFFTLPVGSLEVTIIRDGARPLDPAILGQNAPEGAVAELLKANNLPSPVNNTFNVLLVRAAERMILMDTGLGAANGSLLATLAALNITPEMITDVVFSHQHGDHIGAALTEGKLTFPKAMYHYPDAERAAVEQAPESAAITNNRNLLKAAGDAGQLTLFKGDTEILPGVMAMPAYGHTPGHTAFMLSSEGQSVLATIDTAISHVVSLARPEWHVQFDVDKAQAVATRKRLFGEAADKGIRVIAYHFAFPGTGYIVREGEGFRFIPAM